MSGPLGRPFGPDPRSRGASIGAWARSSRFHVLIGVWIKGSLHCEPTATFHISNSCALWPSPETQRDIPAVGSHCQVSLRSKELWDLTRSSVNAPGTIVCDSQGATPLRKCRVPATTVIVPSSSEKGPHRLRIYVWKSACKFLS